MEIAPWTATGKTTRSPRPKRSKSLYSDAPYGPALIKETDHVTAEYRKLIEAAPFVVLATNGPDGLDCSPRGDPPGFVRVVDEHTLLIPDRRGNNRIDSLRNLVRDPRIALLFLIPGVGETMRIIGRAKISTDPSLTGNFAINGKVPQMRVGGDGRESLLPVHQGDHPLETVGPGEQSRPQNLADAGSILAELTDGKMGGPEHDRLAPERIKETIY